MSPEPVKPPAKVTKTGTVSLAADALPVQVQVVELKRSQAFLFGSIVLPKSVKAGQILSRLTGKATVQSGELITLDPERLLTVMKLDPFSATFLSNFGIKAEIVKRKPVVTAEVVQKVLEVFSSLSQLREGNDCRVLISNSHTLIARTEDARPSTVSGAVLFRVKESATGPAISFYGPIHPAFRKTYHQRQNHSAEMVTIDPLVPEIDQTVAILADWRSLNARGRKAVENRSSEVAVTVESELGKPRNKHKVRAIQIALNAVGLKVDKRTNILVSKTRYEALAYHLLSRMSEVPSIDQHNKQDRAALLASILEQEELIRHIRQRTSQTTDLVEKIMSSRRFNPDRYFVSLGIDPESLSRIRTRPYVAFRDEIEAHKIKLCVEMRSGNVAESKQLVAAISNVALMAEVEICLQWAKFELVAGKAGANAAKKWIEKAGKMLGENEIQPPFDQVKANLRKAYAGCSELSKATGSDEKGLLKKAKAAIDIAGTEQILLGAGPISAAA